MFTGIVEEVGTIKYINRGQHSEVLNMSGTDGSGKNQNR